MPSVPALKAGYLAHVLLWPLLVIATISIMRFVTILMVSLLMMLMTTTGMAIMVGVIVVVGAISLITISL